MNIDADIKSLFTKYISIIKNSIISKNLLEFFVVLYFLQIVSANVETIILPMAKLDLFVIPIITSIYLYVNNILLPHELLVGGAIGSVISYLFYYYLYYKFTNKPLYNAVLIFVVIIVMVVMNSVCAPAIAYAAIGTIFIPKLQRGYLGSYVLSAIVVILISYVYKVVYNETISVSNTVTKVAKPIHIQNILQ